jgi:hypothetical protein
MTLLPPERVPRYCNPNRRRRQKNIGPRPYLVRDLAGSRDLLTGLKSRHVQILAFRRDPVERPTGAGRARLKDLDLPT